MTRTNNFDGLRIIAASMVIIGHAYAITGTQGGLVIWQSYISTLAVEIFFAISGYLILKSFFYDPNFSRFLAKRSLRIFPALIALVIVTTFVLGPLVTTASLNDYFFSASFSKYYSNIILKVSYFLHGVFENNIYPNAVNGVLWTLPVEFLMYLSVPLTAAVSLVALRKHRIAFDLLWTVFTLGLIIGYLCVVHYKIWDLPHIALFQRTNLVSLLLVAPFFGVGGMIFIAERYTTRQIPANLLIVVAVLLQIESFLSIKIFAVIFIPIIIIRVGQASWPVLRDLGRWGDLSYGTYLYGWPVAQTLSLYFLDDFGVGWHMVLTLLISYVLAFGSWHLVEKRALRLKPKRAVEPARQD